MDSDIETTTQNLADAVRFLALKFGPNATSHVESLLERKGATVDANPKPE